MESHSHPEVDGVWVLYGIYHGSFKDPILSTPGWLYVPPRWKCYNTRVLAHVRLFSKPWEKHLLFELHGLQNRSPEAQQVRKYAT